MASIPHLLCNLELAAHSNDTNWAYSINGALYYAYPVVLTLGIIFSLLNAIVTAKMASTSHECYMAAFNVAATLLLAVASVQHLPVYAARQTTATAAVFLPGQTSAGRGTYQSAVAPYLPALHYWFYLACTWLITTAAAQRALRSLAADGKGGSRPLKVASGRLRGILVSCLVFAGALVVALPQFWEFEAAGAHAEHDASTIAAHNCTVAEGGIARRTDALVAEYLWYGWFAAAASVVVPYALLPMLLPPVACAPQYIYTSGGSALSSRYKVKYHVGPSTQEMLVESRDFDRLLTAVVLFYLALSAPTNATRLILDPPALQLHDLVSANPLVASTLRALFEVIAYSFFSLVFFLYLGFSDKYRTALYGLCCCQKTDHTRYY